MKVLATYVLSNTASLNILECSDAYVLYQESWNPTVHKVKLYVDTRHAYFKWGKQRIHLDTCIWV